MDQKLIDFHIANGYFVKAQRMKTANGIFIEYPKSSLVNNVIEDFINCYFIEDGKIKVISEKDKQDGYNITIDVPNYAARTIIAEDVLLQIIKLKIHHSLVFCFDKEGNPMQDINNLVDVLDKPADDIDKAQELLFLNILKDVLLGLDCSQQAQQLYLQDGYRTMKKVFDNGGIQHV